MTLDPCVPGSRPCAAGVSELRNEGPRSSPEPGTSIAADHGDFRFRASRAQASTNESIAGFLLLALFGIFAAAPAGWLGALAWGYVAGRAGPMLCLDLRLARSLSFGVSLLALVGLLGVGIAAGGPVADPLAQLARTATYPAYSASSSAPSRRTM